MATFLSTIQFTEQGFKNIHDTCKRANAVEAVAEKMGVRIIGIYWTLGVNDGIVLMEAADEETAATLMLHVGSLGNVRAQTTRAFRAEEMEAILDQM